ncbi:SGNH/GDSL hydrolase family protein [Paradevosia shaoguanensis]|uniref:SGNH/GDSL hydrolase family protein n=1 Tax=Paradevosia shaoguanensis TaxID=1335043 RepID=UPI000455BF19|nr:SGNH/GDSL hydrolase family protein [Paradevosia shaoguanensis]KFL28859.1 hydrolase [Devosia sp. 17-2-E-8]MBI4045595.1 SGNH/GDSL hydrolase family protein [Devosia nanyangense]QMV00869.1 hydrolase [Devosia sp. D6-9]CDP52325.1 Arylesterase [Devosia sp. DBB001]
MRTVRSILCFGDSNTYGAIPTLARTARHRYARDRRWPGILAKKLGADWQVIEEGLPSRTTVHADPIEGAHKNGLAALPVCLESHMPLDLVIVMLGTNDLKTRFSVNASDIADSIEQVVRAVQTSEAGPEGQAPKVLVVTPPPIAEVDWFADMFRGGAEKAAQLAPLVAAMCERRQIPHLDAGAIVEASAVDGIHLDAEAHRILGLTLASLCEVAFAAIN